MNSKDRDELYKVYRLLNQCIPPKKLVYVEDAEEYIQAMREIIPALCEYLEAKSISPNEDIWPDHLPYEDEVFDILKKTVETQVAEYPEVFPQYY